MSQDRREHERKMIELKVEYRKLNTFFSDYTKNISKGGTFIRTDKPLPVGTRFLFKLVVPKLEGPLELEGEVRWISTGQEEEHPDFPGFKGAGMGIRFIYPDDGLRMEVERVVEQLMADTLGERLSKRLLLESRKGR